METLQTKTKIMVALVAGTALGSILSIVYTRKKQRLFIKSKTKPTYATGLDERVRVFKEKLKEEACRTKM